MYPGFVPTTKRAEKVPNFLQCSASSCFLLLGNTRCLLPFSPRDWHATQQTPPFNASRKTITKRADAAYSASVGIRLSGLRAQILARGGGRYDCKHSFQTEFSRCASL